MFSLSRQFKVLPDAILDMDADLYFLFMEYLGGFSRGREIQRL